MANGSRERAPDQDLGLPPLASRLPCSEALFRSRSGCKKIAARGPRSRVVSPAREAKARSGADEFALGGGGGFEQLGLCGRAVRRRCLEAVGVQRPVEQLERTRQQAHFLEGEEEGQRGFRTLVSVDPIDVQRVETTARGRIVERLAEVIASEEPLERAARLRHPEFVTGK